MRIQLRLTATVLAEMLADLRRPHEYALERVGFLFCRFSRSRMQTLIVFGYDYQPVSDADYIDDPRHGAVIGAGAFRDVIQRIYDQSLGALHVHLHDFPGLPRPSLTDLSETAKFVPDLFHGRRDLPHGALILGPTEVSGRVWFGEDKAPRQITTVKIVGQARRADGGVDV